MAEAVARALVEEAGLAGAVTVESFGTAGYHIGERADPRTDACLRRHGWPHGSHRARQLSAADVNAADLVLCADRSNLANVKRLAGPSVSPGKIRLLGSYDPATSVGAAGEEVPDPWGGGDEDFDLALKMIERSCRGLVGQLANPSG
jgi:protein-tyrosine phosphatase